MYNRFETTVHERENVTDVVSALVDHNSSLEDHIRLLERVRSILMLNLNAVRHLSALISIVSFNFNDSFQWLVAVFIQLVCFIVCFIAQFRLSFHFSTAIVCGYQLFVNIQ